MKQPTDKVLIESYFKGDENSLEILIKKYLGPIYGYALKRVVSPQDAEDLTQEVFLKVWRNLKKFDRKKNFYSWIFSIAKNTCIDFLRRKRTIPYLESIKEQPVQERIFELIDARQLLGLVSKKLSLKYQEVLIDYYVKRLNFREIAEKKGESVNTVKSRYRRAISSLRSYF